MKLTHHIFLGLIGLVLAACGGSGCVQWEGRVQAVASADLENAFACLAEKRNAETPDFVGGPTSASADFSETTDSASSDSITNNQVQGVDEGGIVKAMGNQLLVLRRGRLYLVSTVGSLNQAASIRVAQDESLNSGVWYDELLVKDNRAYVIGYRYAEGGMVEVNSFLVNGGRLSRGKTLFMESNDYFSGSNYTGRLLDGTLVLYSPYSPIRWNEGLYQAKMPHYLNYSGSFQQGDPVLGGNDVFVPLSFPTNPQFYSVVRCDLPADGSFICRAKSLVGEMRSQYYVSRSRVYLSMENHVYSMGLDSEGNTQVHRLKGTTKNQFSFHEQGNQLRLVTRSEGMVYFEQLELADFDSLGVQQPQVLYSVDGVVNRQRFLGDVVLVSVREVGDNVWGDFIGGGSSVNEVLYRYRWGQRADVVPLEESVVRIEPLKGDRALVVTTAVQGLSETLGLHLVELSPARVTDHIELEGRQGEWRSHGFFFRPSGSGGIFGLPVLNTSSFLSWYSQGAANIAYVAVEGNQLSAIGAVSSGVGAGGQCETSCVDWYGNTRPIFFGSREFALMGSELQELDVTSSSIQQVGQRLHLSY